MWSRFVWPAVVRNDIRKSIKFSKSITMYLCNVLKLLTSALAKKFLTKKRLPGGRGVTVHSDTLHHSTISWYRNLHMPHLSLVSLAAKTSCTEPESYLQQKWTFIVTTFNSMQWSIQAALILRRPHLNSAKNKLNYVRQGLGNVQTITLFPRGGRRGWRGGGGRGKYPQESPISQHHLWCARRWHVNKVIAGLIDWS